MIEEYYKKQDNEQIKFAFILIGLFPLFVIYLVARLTKRPYDILSDDNRKKLPSPIENLKNGGEIDTGFGGFKIKNIKTMFCFLFGFGLHLLWKRIKFGRTKIHDDLIFEEFYV